MKELKSFPKFLKFLPFYKPTIWSVPIPFFLIYVAFKVPEINENCGEGWGIAIFFFALIFSIIFYSLDRILIFFSKYLINLIIEIVITFWIISSFVYNSRDLTIDISNNNNKDIAIVIGDKNTIDYKYKFPFDYYAVNTMDSLIFINKKELGEHILKVRFDNNDANPKAVIKYGTIKELYDGVIKVKPMNLSTNMKEKRTEHIAPPYFY